MSNDSTLPPKVSASMFDWKTHFDGQPEWLPQHTIFLCLHGSHAYGTNTTESDVDVRGIAIAPKEYQLGCINRFEQKVQNDPLDLTIFELKKFLRLATDANPNALEILFTEPEDHLYVSPAGRELLDNRHLFLSRKLKHTLSGYAYSQLSRIKLHREWLMNPVLEAPTREEFGLSAKPEIDKNQLQAAMSAITKQLDSWCVDFLEPLDPDMRVLISNKIAEHLAEMGISSDQSFAAAARLVGYQENFILMLDKERRYSAKLNNYKSYQNWLKTRNPKRAANEAKLGFDCYAGDTEFLTDTGWKNFDSINATDKLATVFIRNSIDESCKIDYRTFLGVEYEAYTDKFDAIYNGPMYHISGHHTDCLVTANHRVLFQKVERRSKVKSGWELSEAAHLPDTFELLVAPTPKYKTYSNQKVFQNLPIPPTEYLKLMGWYLSDGTATFRDNKVKSINISQIKHGKLYSSMLRWNKKYNLIGRSSIYEYEKPANEFNPRPHTETILSIRHSEMVNRMIAECGFTETKRIPRYVFNLSKRLIELVLYSLCMGDGTKREHKTRDVSYIYYSKSKELADDIQELAIMAGWETALWGPFLSKTEKYEKLIYQVHLRKISNRTRIFIRHNNVQKVNSTDQRVVCFTVPNGTLITRRNGKVAIHGNCKHGSHLYRLLKTAKEVLSTGQYLVKRPDAEEIKSIRNGAWSFDQLVEWAEKTNKELDTIMLTSPLPKEPDRKKIDVLCIKLTEESLRD